MDQDSTQEIVPGSHAYAHVGAEMVNTDTEHGLEAPKKAVAVHLVSALEMGLCSFWVGLFQRGKATPSQLLNNGSLEELFSQAATTGLTESGPVMLTDSTAAPAKFVYLLPKPNSDEAALGNWIDELVKTVTSWAPAKAGIYLAPELINDQANENLLLSMVRELILATKTTEYFLIPGAHGINTILNASLKIKRELEREKILVYVFH